jgi:hypothetical protein
VDNRTETGEQQMGRHLKPKSEKIAAGTYRKDRDKSASFTIDDDTPEPPDGLGPSGTAFWGLAYEQPWITPADQTQVANVARQIERQETLHHEFAKDPKHLGTLRALKELDRSIEAGLFQLLLTPQSRSRVGIELEVKQSPHRSALELMKAASDGEITWEKYLQEKEGNPHFKRDNPKQLEA